MPEKLAYNLAFLPIRIIILSLLFGQSLAIANNQENLATTKAIFNEIAKAHSISEEQVTLPNDPSLPAALETTTQLPQRLDPTQPTNFIEANLPTASNNDDLDDLIADNNLTLTAIVIKPQQKLAVINGKVIKEGEILAGKKVIEITANTVKLQEQSIIVELKLPNYSIKQEAS